MHDGQQLPNSRLDARRKFVRGAFATPAVLTMCSGSALAATSSAHCIAKQALSPVYNPVSSATDTWLRVLLYTVGGSSNYYVRGADLAVFKRPSNTVYMTATQYQPFNISTNTGGAVTSSAPSSLQASSPTKYAAIRVDKLGNVVGVGTASDGSTNVAGTCWTSFAVAA
jgi:hypothetical protein